MSQSQLQVECHPSIHGVPWFVVLVSDENLFSLDFFLLWLQVVFLPQNPIHHKMHIVQDVRAVRLR